MLSKNIRVRRLQPLVRSYSEIFLSPSPQDSSSNASSSSSSSDSSSTSSSSSPTGIALSFHPRAQAYSEPLRQSDLPTPPQTTHPKPSPAYSNMNPPFHTHVFFTVLETCFPTGVALTLMRATRAMLMDKVGRARREGLGKKDLENQAYLFRAALSELRNDTAMRIRNETSAINASTASLRREVDRLSATMDEFMASLRHENSMELENRKTEARTDLKKQTLALESSASTALIQLGGLRTEIERMRWMNMSRSMMSLAAFGVMLIAFMELTKKPPQVVKPPPPSLPVDDLRRPESDIVEDSNYVT